MTKRKSKYLPFPRNVFHISDEVMAQTIQRLRPKDSHIVVSTTINDVGAIISRVARLLKHGFNVYVKTDENLWMNHFVFLGVARYGYQVYTRRSEHSNSDV